ncbi:protein stu1 [Neofusicoccum parvum]|uniref:Protein stu1 n=1 Tax=Neofusicoccum parvum TaxID=310453 RepID=A0ACB5RX22_9PEZI|nr:protein stu1 [Neofusicoccum parvum]
MKHGALGFNPGDWWINGIFAFHAGVIDLNCTGGGICADKKGAYAVVMKGADEIYTESPDKFRYRCKSNDPGRFRMTSADFRSTYPIRVLRSHTLNSLWSPRSGIRYEGLHKITGWTLRPADPAENDGSSLLWEVEFERDYTLENEHSRISAQKHPLAEETDDYMEYKRHRKEMLHRVREELTQGIPSAIPTTPPAISVPERPKVTIQSPPMSPKTELPFSVGDYCLMRDPVLPGSPESPPLTRTSFFPPQPSPRAQTGPVAKPDRQAPPQPRSLTVPQNLRKSLSPINADVRGKSVSRKPDNPSSSPTTADKDRSKGTKDTSFTNDGKEAKSSLAKSFTRIFSDGALDIADIPESPFGSTFDDDDTNHNESTSYPLDMTPLPSHPIDTFSHPILRQIKWGSAPRDLAANPPTPKSVSRRRRDRAVYEAFSRQGRPPDPRLLLAAIDDIADDVAEPEYPDMVLEEPTVRESHSGYAGFRASSGESGRETRAADQRSDDYMRRIPPGGIDLARFTAQQEAACGGGAGRNDGRFDDSDEAGGHVGRMLRELSAASSPGGGAAAAADAGMAERRKHSGRLASVGGEKGARRSSLSAFDTRMPGPSAVMEDGVARFAPAKGGVRRPTIVRFSGMFKRQSLEETVDEVFDEGAAAEEEEKKKNRKKKEKENDGGSGSVEQLLEKSFASTPNW